LSHVVLENDVIGIYVGKRSKKWGTMPSSIIVWETSRGKVKERRRRRFPKPFHKCTTPDGENVIINAILDQYRISYTKKKNTNSGSYASGNKTVRESFLYFNWPSSTSDKKRVIMTSWWLQSDFVNKNAEKLTHREALILNSRLKMGVNLGKNTDISKIKT